MKKQYLAPRSEKVNFDPLMQNYLGPGQVSIAGSEDGPVVFDE